MANLTVLQVTSLKMNCMLVAELRLNLRPETIVLQASNTTRRGENYLQSFLTNWSNSLFLLSGNTEHLTGATAGGRDNHCGP